MATARGLLPRSIAGQRFWYRIRRSITETSENLPLPAFPLFPSDNISGKHLAGVSPSGSSQWHHIHPKGAVYGLHHPLVRENISSSINGGGEQVSIRTGQTEAMIKCSQWCLTVLVAHLHRSFLFSKAKFTNLGRSVYSQEGEAGD